MLRRLGPMLLVVLFIHPTALHADAASDTATYQFPEVVITALRGRDSLRRIPAAAFVLTRERIEQTGATRVATLLQTLPGLYGYKQSSNGDVSVVDPRGFTANGESSYLKVLVDGQDTRDLENGNVDWDWLLPHDVDHLEVVEGPGAWVHGDGSEGGIVNVVRGAIPDGLHSDCGLQAGSFGLTSGGLAVSGQTGTLAGSLRGSGRRVLGFRDHSREKVLSGGGDARFAWSDRTRVSLSAALLDADRQDPGALRPDQIAEDRTQADTGTDFAHPRRLNLGATLVTGENERSEWRFAPYLRVEDVEQVRTLLYQTKDHPTQGLTAGGELGFRHGVTLAGRPVTLSVEAQLERAHLESHYYNFDTGTRGALESDGESWRTNASAFAGATLALDPRTTARLGVRQDAVRVRAENRIPAEAFTARTFWLTSPYVAVTREIAPPLSVYGSYSAAFRVPTLNQLFDRRPYFNPFTFETVYLSNSGLSPQKSDGFEIGARHQGTRGGYAVLSLYSILVRDEIDFDAATNSYANISRSWHRGVQVGSEQPLWHHVSGVANYTYAPTTIRGGAYGGKQINAVPRHLAYAGLRLAAGGGSLEGGVRYVGPQFLEKANLVALPDFGVVDVAGSLRVARVRATLRVQNLMDRDYSDTGYFIDLGPALQEARLYPAAGRGFALSLTAD